MKIAEEYIKEEIKLEGFEDISDMFNNSSDTRIMSIMIDCMNKYKNDIIDLCSQKAKALLAGNDDAVLHTDFWAEVDKQSILSLKKQI